MRFNAFIIININISVGLFIHLPIHNLYNTYKETLDTYDKGQ